MVVPTFCAGNVRLVADRLTSVPTPVKVTTCGLSTALSLIVSAPVASPVVLGLRATLIVQLAPVARLVPQALVWVNSPLAAMPLISRGAFPTSITITDRGKLGVPTTWEPSERLRVE